jgi:hypothetical protein
MAMQYKQYPRYFLYEPGGIGYIIQTVPSLIAYATYPRRTSFRWKSTGQISSEYMYNILQCTVGRMYLSHKHSWEITISSF